MQYPKNLSQASDATVLEIWVTSNNYESMVTTLSLLEYAATPPQVRRRVKRILVKRRWLPIHRPATSNDYTRIKAELWEQRKHEDIL